MISLLGYRASVWAIDLATQRLQHHHSHIATRGFTILYNLLAKSEVEIPTTHSGELLIREVVNFRRPGAVNDCIFAKESLDRSVSNRR